MTAGYGLMLGVLAHLVGWPLARGGSQQIADALVAVLEKLGGRVECNRRIESLAELPTADAVLLDLTPRQVLAIAGDAVPDRYRKALTRFRYGPGVFKLDWALDGPIPWANPDCARAATVHLGGTLDEITAAEADVQAGRHPERPYVLLAQQSLFDPTRVPDGVQAVWAYCHVPNGSTVDMTDRIERRSSGSPRASATGSSAVMRWTRRPSRRTMPTTSVATSTAVSRSPTVRAAPDARSASRGGHRSTACTCVRVRPRPEEESTACADGTPPRKC